MANILDFIGRIMISSVFLFSGYNKIFSYGATVNWMEGFNIPGFLLTPAIAIEIIMPIMLIIGYQTRVASTTLALFSIATAVIFHLDLSNQMQTVALLKNLGLAGGLIFIAIHGTKDWALEKKKKYVRL